MIRAHGGIKITCGAQQFKRENAVSSIFNQNLGAVDPTGDTISAEWAVNCWVDAVADFGPTAKIATILL